jgi:outer membrane protein assembly factor BamB
MYALNTTTGDQIWKFPTEQYLRAPIVVDDRLYFGVDTDAPNTGKVYCLNATTGEHVWDFITQDKEVSVAVAYGKAYVGCGHWTTSATGCIYCLDMYDGSYIWSFQTNRDITGALAVANGKVYFTASYEGWDCIVYALNATDGAVVWSTTRYSDGSAGRTAVAYGKLFIHLGYYADGIYALNETNGDEIWASHVPSGGGPVIADGKVFFAKGNPANVFNAVNEATGAVIWSYVLSGGVHSATSAIANGRVFVADHWDPKLYAFGAPTAPPLSVSISPLSASIYMGQSVSFTSSVSGGAPLYNYQWYLNNNPVPSATSSGWTFTPTTPGTFTIYLNVTDSLSDSAKSNEATVTVASQLSTSISPMSASIFEGQSVTFASTASGGYTPYSYQWYLDGAPVSGATSASWTFTPATSGVYYVYLKLTDAKANTAQSDTARITVTAVPVGGYSIPIQAPTTAKPLTLCLMLTAILTIAFTTIKRKTTRKTKQPP